MGSCLQGRAHRRSQHHMPDWQDTISRLPQSSLIQDSTVVWKDHQPVPCNRAEPHVRHLQSTECISILTESIVFTYLSTKFSLPNASLKEGLPIVSEGLTDNMSGFTLNTGGWVHQYFQRSSENFLVWGFWSLLPKDRSVQKLHAFWKV